ncbi:hypothetical protein CPB84DRAFT_1763129 [Gymnopilus junonius]|uniref:DUF6699 domain-containing protein n=1 Tax=Gymnopilus junonius TaxID=109634 RepID=A0A9P5TU86_GYMJU|nr:hypothetical protein CPB84DRAFT_1763129 [Gymnopilus junonius]
MPITSGPTVSITNPRNLWEYPSFYRHYHDMPMFQRRYHPPQPPQPTLVLIDQLSYNLNDFNVPYLVWDIIHPPRTACLCDRRYFRKWTMPDLSSVAIQPSVAKVWVTSDHPVLAYWIGIWGPISIQSDEITVKDTLEGIYFYLRTHLTKSDLQHVSSEPGNRKALRYARAKRAKESSEVEAVVLKQEYRRVDVLGGHRQFQGLRIVISPDNTWRLHLGLLPGPVPRLF